MTELPPRPDWLQQALDAVRGSAGFNERCEQSAKIAFALARLRRERQERGFFAASVREYLQTLAETVESSLTSIMAWLGIAGLDPERRDASGLARLLRLLGLSRDEVVTLFRISFAEKAGLWPVPMSAAFRGESGGPAGLLPLSRVLTDIETELPAKPRAMLLAALEDVELAFRTPGEAE